MMRQSPKPCNRVQGEANPYLVPGEIKYAEARPPRPVGEDASTKF